MEWEEFGLSIFSQKNSLPKGIDKVTIDIQASIAGRYQFSEDSHLVSAVFWLQCKPKCEFAKPITAKIHHCASSRNISKLKFARASHSRKEASYYAFKQLEGGQFHDKDHYGAIELNDFSGLAITQEGTNERDYYAGLFYLAQEIDRQGIHVALTWNEPSHITVRLCMQIKHS